MNTKTNIVIIGAGLTGLSLGHFLKKAGKNFNIIEKDKRTGGVINTSVEDGFIFENGPNTGVLSTVEIVKLFEDLNDRCFLETADKSAAKRYILKNGSWVALPSGPFSGIRTPLFTLKDKFRILGEPFRKPGTNPDETVSELVIRRMGKSFLDYAVNPFISGVYAGDPARLVTRYALPKLYNLEQNYGSFIRGSIAKGKEKKSEEEKKATREVFSVEGGLMTLINAMTEEIGREKIFTGRQNIKIHPLPSGYKVTSEDIEGTVHEITCDTVVTTAGGYALPEMVPFVPSKTMKDISSLNYAKVVQVSAGYKSWHGDKLDAFGGLVPAVEKRKILGILFPSAIFKGRAPEGGALLSIFLGGIRDPEIIGMDDDEITGIVLKEISQTLSGRNNPDIIKINRYQHAIPQYEKSTGARLAAINRIQQENPGLILAGNIRDGIGMADRVKQAKAICDSIVAR